MAPAASRGPYNLPGGERDVDNLTYNPQADARSDDTTFDPNTDNDSLHPVGARGAGNQPTGRDWQQEDQETASSDATGQIPRSKYYGFFFGYVVLMLYTGEVDDLLSSATREERSAQGRTRGVKVDAWKQERELDQSLDEAGAGNSD